MPSAGNGILVPQGGGDAIPLVRDNLVIGRRETCDICLQLPNVSGRHCELIYKDGVWQIFDLNSTNGVKVNGDRVQKKVLHPGDTITIAKRTYVIDYTPVIAKRAMEELMEDDEEDVMEVPLLERAGLVNSKKKPGRG